MNIEGHVARLVAVMQSDYWRDVSDSGHSHPHFPRSRTSADDIDTHVWQVCQEKQLYLLTNNRNDDGPASLEATLRKFNSPSSLPIFTLSDSDRIYQSRDYTERMAESLFDKLLRVDSLKEAVGGCGCREAVEWW